MAMQCKKKRVGRVLLRPCMICGSKQCKSIIPTQHMCGCPHHAFAGRVLELDLCQLARSMQKDVQSGVHCNFAEARCCTVRNLRNLHLDSLNPKTKPIYPCVRSTTCNDIELFVLQIGCTTVSSASDKLYHYLQNKGMHATAENSFIDQLSCIA